MKRIADTPDVNTVICGDVLETIQTFPDESIDCVITSPPYWQMRDYKWRGSGGSKKLTTNILTGSSD